MYQIGNNRNDQIEIFPQQSIQSIMSQKQLPESIRKTAIPENYGLTAEDRRKKGAQDIFGASYNDIGNMYRKVQEMRASSLGQYSPMSSAIQQGANRQASIAQAQAQSQGRNLSAGERSQIQRTAEQDISQQKWKEKSEAEDKYAKMAANLASNTMGYVFGKEALEKEIPQYVESGSVICTELFRQGYISDDIYMHDTNFGVLLREERPHIYCGYIMWAPTIVKLMRKSKVFTKIVAFFGVPWAVNMAYNRNLFGKVINFIGMPICGLLGKIFGGNYEIQQN